MYDTANPLHAEIAGLNQRILDLEALCNRYEASSGALATALQDIASRGIVVGHSSGNALRMRLVGSQSIARAALKAVK